jgi:hypothetical protein
MPINRRHGGNGRAVCDPSLIIRDQRAWQLRVAHVTYKQIAAELGVSIQTAFRAVENHARRIPNEEEIQQKKLMLAEIDELSRAALAVMLRKHVLVSTGEKVVYHEGEPLIDDGPVLQAIDRLMRLQERKARLMGLDAPTKNHVDVVTRDVWNQAMVDLLAEREAKRARLAAELAERETDD